MTVQEFKEVLTWGKFEITSHSDDYAVSTWKKDNTTIRIFYGTATVEAGGVSVQLAISCGQMFCEEYNNTIAIEFEDAKLFITQD